MEQASKVASSGSGRGSIADALMHAGLVLVAHELVKSMIVNPIKVFYERVVFRGNGPFRTYEHDVLSRDAREYRACLLYLRDFMCVLDDDDLQCVEDLRSHRHLVAHELPRLVSGFCNDGYLVLIERVDATLFKLSNHRAYMELGADPVSEGWDWPRVWGNEYILFTEVLSQVRSMRHIAQQRSSKSPGEPSLGDGAAE